MPATPTLPNSPLFLEPAGFFVDTSLNRGDLDDGEIVTALAIKHDTVAPRLKQLNDYYEGRQPLAYMHPEVQRLVGDRIRPVIIFWPQLVVDAMDERLDVEGFRLPTAGPDDDLWRVWQENNLDEESQLAHVDAMVMRRSYAVVGTNEDDADTPLVTVESPLEMFAHLDPRTRQVAAALRRWRDTDSLVRLPDQYATLYLPDRTVWYDWAGSGAWREIGRDEHNLGACPVVPLVNRSRLADRHGKTELAPVLPLSDAANKIATDMMVAAEFHAIPLRALFGVGPEDITDQDGNPLTALQAIMGRLLTIPDTDGPNTVRGHQFDASSLSNYHDTINQLAKLVASMSGLPPHFLGYSTENPASADAIRSSESRLIKRAERKQRAFGGSWEQVARLVRRFQTGDWDPELRRLETQWRDASTPTVAQKADAATKLHAAGIVPLRQTREDLGYTSAQIDRMEEEDDKAGQRAGAAVGNLADAAALVAGTRAPAADLPAGAPVGGPAETDAAVPQAQ